MKTRDLLYLGIKGSVVALDRLSGAIIWRQALASDPFVSVLVEDGRIYATCSGEGFCLDAVDGRILWHNQLKGFGRGIASLAVERASDGQGESRAAEKRRRDEQAAAAATVSTAASS